MTQREQTLLKDARIAELLLSGRYIATPSGLIISTRFKGHERKVGILRPRITNKGYEAVSLVDSEGTISVVVHRVIAIGHVPNPLGLPEVNHKDGNKRNNSFKNLEWVTSRENTLHAEETGLRDNKAKGESLPQSKLDDEKVREIKARLRRGDRQTDIARDFGVEYPTIYAIRKGITWRHVECM